MKRWAIDKDSIDIKILNTKTGEEFEDSGDVKPTKKKFNPNESIMNLLKSVYPSYELASHPLLREYGYGTFGMACENWYWSDDLINAPIEKLWEMYALIQADWLADCEYRYNKEVYINRKYFREEE